MRGGDAAQAWMRNANAVRARVRRANVFRVYGQPQRENESGSAKAFSVEVDGHTFSGSYVGVFALKTGDGGRIEKMACGQCSSVMRDGKAVVTLEKAADVVLHAGSGGGYRAVVVGPAGSNWVTVAR